MTYFKNKVTDLGSIKAGSTNVLVEWLFEDIKKSDIAFYLDKDGNKVPAIRKSCGCTAKVEVLDDRITARYTDTTKTGSKSKTITVFLRSKDSSVPVLVKNEAGKEIINRSLESVVLKFNLKSI